MPGDVEATTPHAVRIATRSHRVRVIAEQRSDVTFEGKAELVRDGDRVTIDSVTSAITVRVPEGTALIVGSASAKVSIRGSVGDAAVSTESGRIEIADANDVDARTTSASVVVGKSAGECRVRGGSGRIDIGACGSADLVTDSGRIVAREVDGPARAHCVSGRIDISMASAHDVEAETVTGRIRISLPPGVEAWQPAASAPVDRPSEPFDCVVNARSVTGKVDVSNR